jgi:diguanylate cyclase (GGDEF)-like protein
MLKWFSLQAELANFHHRKAILIFSMKMSFAAVILSLVVMAISLPALHYAGLLPIAFLPAVWCSVVLSWLIGGVVSGVLSAFAGSAIHELSVSRAEFQRLSRTDMLSGLLNRRAFTEALERVDADASLVIFDVDRFKAINDRHGHASGDAVIVAISRIFAETFSGESVVGRLGGEEFGAIVRGGNLSERAARIERVRTQIAESRVQVETGDVRVTISAGIADIWSGRNKDAIYTAADKALYLAKALGRNRVVHESENLQSSWRHAAGEALSGVADAMDCETRQYGYGI